jgi:hypothetical protein
MADGVASSFKGIPLEELIGGPLTAACNAQVKLARAQYEFIEQIAFEEGGGGKKTRLVEFDLNRPTETPDGYGSVPIHVQAPYLGLVPVPALLVEDVNIEFQMEVTATESSTAKTDSEVSTSSQAKVGWGPFSASVSVQGKVSSSRENTRSSNQTAKYQVRVSARQQPATEGLSRLMDIMAQCTSPLPSPNSGNA